MSEQNKESFIKNKAYWDNIEKLLSNIPEEALDYLDNEFKKGLEESKDEYNQIMSNPEEQIAFWKNEMEFAEAKLDEIINNHDCTLSPEEGCEVCNVLVDAGLTTFGDRFAEQEANRQEWIDLQIEAEKEKDLPF